MYVQNAQASRLCGQDWAQRSEEPAGIGSQDSGQGAAANRKGTGSGPGVWASLTAPSSEVGDGMRGWEQYLQPTCRRIWCRRCQESRWKQA